MWKKDSNIVPSLFFSHFFYSLFFLVGFFGLFFLFPHMGQCPNNDDHHTFIYLQLDTRTSMTLYENASGGVPVCATI